MGRLTDRVALITGSDSGIGQATAVAFAGEGADVVVNYARREGRRSRARRTGAEHPLEAGRGPRGVARLAVFLASVDADYVTGSTYVMDGGLMQNNGQGA